MNEKEATLPNVCEPNRETTFARSIVGGVLMLAWAALLIVLMIRMPIADLLAGLDILTLDTVLSAAFIVVGVAAAICGLCFRSKSLITLSLLQAAFLLCFALSVCLYLVFFNGDILAVGLYFINPFAALLSCHFMIFLVVSVLLILLSIVLFAIYARKERKRKKSASA